MTASIKVQKLSLVIRIHSLLGVAREKVRNFPLNMCSILQNNSYNSIPKCIVGCYMFTFTRALKQMGI
jgi:hypothetical protein